MHILVHHLPKTIHYIKSSVSFYCSATSAVNRQQKLYQLLLLQRHSLYKAPQLHQGSKLRSRDLTHPMLRHRDKHYCHEKFSAGIESITTPVLANFKRSHRAVFLSTYQKSVPSYAKPCDANPGKIKIYHINLNSTAVHRVNYSFTCRSGGEETYPVSSHYFEPIHNHNYRITSRKIYSF